MTGMETIRERLLQYRRGGAPLLADSEIFDHYRPKTAQTTGEWAVLTLDSSELVTALGSSSRIQDTVRVTVNTYDRAGADALYHGLLRFLLDTPNMTLLVADGASTELDSDRDGGAVRPRVACVYTLTVTVL